MKKFTFFILVLMLCKISVAHALTDSLLYRDADEKVQSIVSVHTKEVLPDHLLPSQRLAIKQHVLSLKAIMFIGELFNGYYPHRHTVSVEGCPFPQSAFASLLQTLFPSEEEFLIRVNNCAIDPVAELSPLRIGQLVREVEKLSSYSAHILVNGYYEWREKSISSIGDILKCNSKAAEVTLQSISNEDFERYEVLHELAVSFDQILKTVSLEDIPLEDREDISQIFGSKFPLTTGLKVSLEVRYTTLKLNEGDLEDYLPDRYEGNKGHRALKILRKRRFLVRLIDAIHDQALHSVDQNEHLIQKLLTVFFWEKAKGVEDVAEFYLGLTGCSQFSELKLEQGSAFETGSTLNKELTANPESFFELGTSEMPTAVWYERIMSNFFPISLGTTKFQNNSCADCVETSFRNLLMLFRRKITPTGEIFFDFSGLADSPATGFFNGFPGFEQALLQSARDAWGQILYDRGEHNIRYWKPKEAPLYEVKSGFLNMLNVFKYLLELGDDILPKSIFDSQTDEALTEAFGRLAHVLDPTGKLTLLVEDSYSFIEEQDFYGQLIVKRGESPVARLTMSIGHLEFTPIKASENSWSSEVMSHVSDESRVLRIAPFVGSREAFDQLLPMVTNEQLHRFILRVDSFDRSVKLAILKAVLTQASEHLFTVALGVLSNLHRLNDWDSNREAREIIYPLMDAALPGLSDRQIKEILTMNPEMISSNPTNPILEWLLKNNKEKLLSDEILARVANIRISKALQDKLELFISTILPRFKRLFHMEIEIPLEHDSVSQIAKVFPAELDSLSVNVVHVDMLQLLIDSLPKKCTKFSLCNDFMTPVEGNDMERLSIEVARFFQKQSSRKVSFIVPTINEVQFRTIVQHLYDKGLPYRSFRVQETQQSTEEHWQESVYAEFDALTAEKTH
ncbi:MAG: hypothetical protein HOK20_05155 [Alphaproteobacteria bacterium]|nr:hypothetical protein [Alphaproteobacteria bacterium]